MIRALSQGSFAVRWARHLQAHGGRGDVLTNWGLETRHAQLHAHPITLQICVEGLRAGFIRKSRCRNEKQRAQCVLNTCVEGGAALLVDCVDEFS